jgi:hypothetical protein
MGRRHAMNQKDDQTRNTKQNKPKPNKQEQQPKTKKQTKESLKHSAKKWLCINGFALTKIRAARAKQTRESEPQLSDSRSPVGKLGHGHCWRKFPIGLPTLKGVAELKVKLQTVQTNLHEKSSKFAWRKTSL